MSNRDPLESLIDYIGTVKPYHTKVYEVLLEYEYTEAIRASIKESYHIYTTISNSDFTGTVGRGGTGIPDMSNWAVCDGVGWDMMGFGVGTFDYPQSCSTSSPNRISATVQDNMQLFVDVEHSDSIETYAQFQTTGWDIMPFDTQGFDDHRLAQTWLQIEQQDDPEEPVGATITESLVIQVT